MNPIPITGLVPTRRIDGLLELLDSNQLKEDRLPDAALPSIAASRGVEREKEMSQRWQALIRVLQGYKAEEVLLRSEPIWVPIFNIHLPPSGSAIVKYERTETQKISPELKIFGIGYGNASAIAFSESVSIEANECGKVYQVRMNLSATRYVHPNRTPFVRYDIDAPGEQADYRVIDLVTDEDVQIPDLKSPLEWEIVKSIELSGSKDRGSYIWQYKTGESTKWKASLGLGMLATLNLDLKVDIELEQAQAFDVIFRLPYGQDYVFYQRVGESLLIPHSKIGRYGAS